MRRRVIGVGILGAILATGIVAGLVVRPVRAPEGGLFAWDAGSGELRVLEGGWYLLPRRRWARSEAVTLRGETPLHTGDELEITARFAWRPDAGSHSLVPAEAPARGLALAISGATERLLHDLPFACIAVDGAAAGACPEDPNGLVRERLAGLLGVRPSRLEIRLEVPERTRRRAALVALRREVPEPGGGVLVLGFDGLDWDQLMPLVESGGMPNLGRLLEAGTWGTLETISPILSPLIWTTVATGVSPEVHGILDFVERDSERGSLVPVTSRSRQAPALWSIASALGRRVGVVGWWGTWPAEPVDGILVSDRLYYTLTQQRQEAQLRGDTRGIVHPPEATQRFAELRRRAVDETGWEVVRSYLDVPREAFDHAVAEGRGMGDPIDGFRSLLAATRTYLEAGLALAAERPDLMMVYLQGTDTIGHLLAGYMPPPVAAGVTLEEAAIYAAAVPRYFAHVDDWLARYLEAFPLDAWTWLLVSDHGFKWGDDRPRGLSEAVGLTDATAPLWHTAEAVFLLAGGQVSAHGRVRETGSVYDVSPTVASLLGLPAGADWRGQVLPGVAAGELEPVDYAALLPTEPPESSPEADAAVERELLAELEALGYLGARAEQGELRSRRGEDRTSRELNNLGLLQLSEGRLEEAEATLRRAIAASPEHPYGYVNLNLVLLERRRYDEADDELWRAVASWSAVEEGWREPGALIVAVARSYAERDLPSRAVALLQRGVEERPRVAALWLELLSHRARVHDCDPGLEEARRAAELHPEVARIHGHHGLMAMCRGETDEARRAMGRSLEIDPDQPVLREALAGLP